MFVIFFVVLVVMIFYFNRPSRFVMPEKSYSSLSNREKAKFVLKVSKLQPFSRHEKYMLK